MENCPTDQMRGDFFTKPLQGSLCRGHVSAIMNLPVDYLARARIGSAVLVDPQECVAISGNEGCLDQDGSVLSDVRLSTGSDAVLAEPVTS